MALQRLWGCDILGKPGWVIDSDQVKSSLGFDSSDLWLTLGVGSNWAADVSVPFMRQNLERTPLGPPEAGELPWLERLSHRSWAPSRYGVPEAREVLQTFDSLL